MIPSPLVYLGLTWLAGITIFWAAVLTLTAMVL